MFSNNISVRTSDSHIIFNVETNKRTNYPKDVVIGNHVWVAPNSKIMKGVNIGDNSIIGSNTIVTKSIDNDCLAVVMPATIVRKNINWDRHRFD